MDLLYVEDERPPLGEDDVNKAIFIGARRGRTGCYDYVELQDLVQVCWVDLLEKPGKYNRYRTQGNFNGLVKEMARTAGLFAQREKAELLGYRPQDLFYYSKKRLRRVIPIILESWQSGDLYEFENPDRAEWVDVDRALKKLSASDLQILRWAFTHDEDTVARRLGITQPAASMRVSRVLDKLRELLGGENPTPRRRSLSNAASQAQTRNQWDGEG